MIEKGARGGAGAKRSLSLGRVLPDSLTCAQVLTSSGRPWGLLRLSFSLWNEHGQLSSPFESDLPGKRGNQLFIHCPARCCPKYRRVSWSLWPGFLLALWSCLTCAPARGKPFPFSVCIFLFVHGLFHVLPPVRPLLWSLVVFSLLRIRLAHVFDVLLRWWLLGNGNPLQYSCLEEPMEPGMLQSMG